MKWFQKYASNTIAGSGNQSAFVSDGAEKAGRVYYRVSAGGEYGYSFLYTNILDSTFADGTRTNANMLCGEWKILRAQVGVCSRCAACEPTQPRDVQPLLFGGSESKTVAPGEFFTTDEVRIRAEQGEYLCVEVHFRGRLIPCHPESIIPSFIWQDGRWQPSQELPFVSMVGCDRPVRAKVGFMGDSITQGIGTPNNAYSHWNALCAQKIGNGFSWWNLGLGYARGYDAAGNGAWLYKAKQCDYVVVAYGTNDIGHDRTSEQIVTDLRTIIEKLHEAGVKVLLQTLPPFHRRPDLLQTWLETNRRVRNELAPLADAFYDVVPVLIDGAEEEGKARYGDHPDETGCALWAEGLMPVLREMLERE